MKTYDRDARFRWSFRWRDLKYRLARWFDREKEITTLRNIAGMMAEARRSDASEYREMADALSKLRHSIKFDLVAHLQRQREFSERTFGPGARTAGVIDHIRKELSEIEAKPHDVFEWVDVTLLALDGAWRAGFTPEEIAAAISAKQIRNESRDWPDWRTAELGKAIEHVRGEVA